MSYAGKFLNAKGQSCTINRTTPANSKVSIRRSTKASRDLGIREGYWEGLILADAMLQSGEVLSITDDRGTTKYLVQSVNTDFSSTEHAFFAAKCNAVLTHKRYTQTVDEDGNLVEGWQVLNAAVDAYGEIVTYRLRQEDPGLLDSTKYVFQVPKSISAQLLDRIVYNGNNYQVVSIDDVALEGLCRIQVQADVRPEGEDIPDEPVDPDEPEEPEGEE